MTIKNTDCDKEKTPYEIQTISGNIVDVVNNEIYAGALEIKNGKIQKITRLEKTFGTFILPGFIDSHIHVESSMLAPSEFARVSVKSGTVAVVTDPHEIANVVGIDGIDFMIKNGKNVPFKFFFGAPSCVPATTYETSGATLDEKDVEKLLKRDEIKYLAEVMYFQGVISKQKEITAKINAAKLNKKPIDGHAPGLSKSDLKEYINAGISTDHECSTIEEALEKISLGMNILIREGSAAKDFDALHSIIKDHPDYCMFSSDDRHPNDLVEGHINLLVKKALALGYDKMQVLKCACTNPVKHYGLEVGLIQEGDFADFIEIDNFNDLNILKTVINGIVVSENGWSLISKTKPEYINNFNTELKNEKDFISESTGKNINVIEVTDGLLTTKRLSLNPTLKESKIISDTNRDILKITVVNRYKNSPPAVGFIKGFGIKKGAIASSVAHDSHNLVAVGTSDEEITKAINLVIKSKGGLSVVNESKELILPLPIGGLMSDKGAFEVAQNYKELEAEVKNMGSTLTDPFMTMSFMTLLAIPDLKLSDKGLFDSKKFEFIKLEK